MHIMSMRNSHNAGGFVSGIATGAMVGMAMGAAMGMNADNATKRKVRRTKKAVKNFTNDVYGNMSKWMD